MVSVDTLSRNTIPLTMKVHHTVNVTLQSYPLITPGYQSHMWKIIEK
jgi:hypothetical protein